MLTLSTPKESESGLASTNIKIQTIRNMSAKRVLKILPHKSGLGGARIPRTPIDPPLTLELNHISRMSNTDNLLGDHCQAAQSFCLNTYATYITFKKGLKSHLFNEYCM